MKLQWLLVAVVLILSCLQVNQAQCEGDGADTDQDGALLPCVMY